MQFESSRTVFLNHRDLNHNINLIAYQKMHKNHVFLTKDMKKILYRGGTVDHITNIYQDKIFQNQKMLRTTDLEECQSIHTALKDSKRSHNGLNKLKKPPGQDTISKGTESELKKRTSNDFVSISSFQTFSLIHSSIKFTLMMMKRTGGNPLKETQS